MIALGKKKKKYEATDVASPRKVEGWGIVLTWRYADGSWNTETITDLPDDVANTIDDYLTNYEKEDKKSRTS